MEATELAMEKEKMVAEMADATTVTRTGQVMREFPTADATLGPVTADAATKSQAYERWTSEVGPAASAWSSWCGRERLGVDRCKEGEGRTVEGEQVNSCSLDSAHSVT